MSTKETNHENYRYPTSVDGEDDVSETSQGEIKSEVKTQDSLRNLFQNLNILPPSPSTNANNDSQPSNIWTTARRQTEGNDHEEENEDILEALDVGKIVLQDDDEEDKEESREGIDKTKEVLQKDQAIERLAKSLRQELGVGDDSFHSNKMYEEMAKAMLKCKINSRKATVNERDANDSEHTSKSTEIKSSDSDNAKNPVSLPNMSQNDVPQQSAATNHTTPQDPENHEKINNSSPNAALDANESDDDSIFNNPAPTPFVKKHLEYMKTQSNEINNESIHEKKEYTDNSTDGDKEVISIDESNSDEDNGKFDFKFIPKSVSNEVNPTEMSFAAQKQTDSFQIPDTITSILPPKTSTKPGKLRKKASVQTGSTPEIIDLTDSQSPEGKNGTSCAPPQFSSDFASNFPAVSAFPTFNMGVSNNRQQNRTKAKLKERKGSNPGRKLNHTTKMKNSTRFNPFAFNTNLQGQQQAQSSNPSFQTNQRQSNLPNQMPIFSQNQTPSFSNNTDPIPNNTTANNSTQFNKGSFMIFDSKISYPNGMNQTSSQINGNLNNVNGLNNAKKADPSGPFLFNMGTHTNAKNKKDNNSLRRKATRITKKIRKPITENPPSTIYTNSNNGASDSIFSDNKVQTTPNKAFTSPPTARTTRVNPDFSGRKQRIAYLRSEAREYYTEEKYVAAIRSYTIAIEILDVGDAVADHDRELLATLHGNRAAALMMLGAYSTAANDTEDALNFVNDLTYEISGTVEILAPESATVLCSKFTCRLGRAYLKCGDMLKAESAFNSSIERCQSVLRRLQQSSNDPSQKVMKIIQQTLKDSMLAKKDIQRYQNEVRSADLLERSIRNSNKKKVYVQILAHMNNALILSPGCKLLHEKKVNTLKNLGKWRDLSWHCEKIACEKVKLDRVFNGDLKGYREDDWLVEIGFARFLKADHFENRKGKYVPLKANAVEEAIVRLPRNLLPHYLRSLRLEERYEESEKACSTLKSFIDSELKQCGNINFERGKFVWLKAEIDKLRRTRTAKEKGDELFRNRLYGRAAGRYAACINIDEEGGSIDGGIVGGRLHAVLHCNRAACFMAMSKYNEAIGECSFALRIESRYMKAILRRARSYSRGKNYQKSINDYKQWINYVGEAKDSNSYSESSEWCYFDDASKITMDDKHKVMEELASAKQKMKDDLEAQASAKARAERERHYYDNFNKSSYYHEWNNHTKNQNRQRGSRKGEKDYKKGTGHKKYEKTWNENNSNRSNTWNNTQSEDVGSPGSDLSKCHYEVLQISNNSSSVDIKKAYRKVRPLIKHIFYISILMPERAF